jgi:rhodanese-related sulfurtransferase
MRAKHLLVWTVVGLVLAAWAMPALAFDQLIKVDELTEMVAKKPTDGGYFLVDSRPEIKYMAGHIPHAVTIPFQEMDELLDELPADKSVPLVFYCGGLKCKLSHKAADLAVKQGYQNVRVFAEGEPGWQKAGNTLWVSAGYIKMILNDRERIALIVDARPDVKYNKGTVPGAMNLSLDQYEARKGLLPADKALEIIAFCGGMKCDKSQKLADKAMADGYSNIKVYAYGYPDWKKKSTRAFAMVNPKDGASKAAPAEEMIATGEIKKSEMIKLLETKPEGFLLVDVRPVEEFEKAHIPGAINLLDETIGEHLDQIKSAKDVVFYCNTGSRAAIAYYTAEDAGIKTTRFLNLAVDFDAEGGFVIN